jgi:DNA-binding MarR family transcriptional regulator
MAMAPERLSRSQRHILAWLVAEGQRMRSTMAASYPDLVQALVAQGVDKGNVSTSLTGLEVKGLVTIARTPGGRAEAVDLTVEGRHRVAALTASGEEGYLLMYMHRLGAWELAAGAAREGGGHPHERSISDLRT